MVGLLRRHTGWGPTKAKALISSDLVVVTLADCLTTAERRVAAVGHGELVVHIDPPTFMRHDEINGCRFKEPVDVTFEGVKVERGRD